MTKKTKKTRKSADGMATSSKRTAGETYACGPNVAKRRNSAKCCEMRFDCEDVIITDPGYVISNPRHWLSFIERTPLSCGPAIRDSGKTRILVADTLWGDWLCSLTGTLSGAKHGFGTFTADAGMVCACAPGSRRLRAITKRLPAMCYTLLEGFTGTVRIIHSKGVCHVEGSGKTEDGEVKFRSRRIG